MQKYEIDRFSDGAWRVEPPLNISRVDSAVEFYLASDVDARIAELEKRIAHFEAGEYICQRCGIRQDPPKGEPAF